MSKASSHQLDQTVKKYLISCMDFTGYEVEPKTIAEKIQACYDIYYHEIGHWSEPRKGRQASINDWLSSLASACTIAFNNHEILELAVKWGSLPNDYSERQADILLENYFNFMAAKLVQLFDGYHVPKTEG